MRSNRREKPRHTTGDPERSPCKSTRVHVRGPLQRMGQVGRCGGQELVSAWLRRRSRRATRFRCSLTDRILRSRTRSRITPTTIAASGRVLMPSNTPTTPVGEVSADRRWLRRASFAADTLWRPNRCQPEQRQAERQTGVSWLCGRSACTSWLPSLSRSSGPAVAEACASVH